MRKTIRYLKYIFTDCYKAFPEFFVVNYVVDSLGVLSAVAAPMLLARILELAGGDRSDGGKALVGAIMLYGFSLACTPIGDVIFRTASKKARVLGERYFGGKRIAFAEKIRLEELENPETLDKFQRANAGENVQIDFFEQVNLTLKSAVTSIGMVAVVGRYSPVLILTGLVTLLPAVLTKVYYEKRMTAFRRGQSSILRRCDYLRSLFSDREVVKEMRVMGFEGHVTDKWKRANAEKVEGFRRINRDVRKKQVWGIIVSNCCYAFNIGMAFYLMVEGRVSPGAFAACLSAFTSYDSSLQIFTAMLFKAVATYHVVEDYYDYFAIPTEEDGSREYRPFQDAVSAEDVHFRYSGSDRDALKGLTCRIQKGEHVVIVGENGSGKTTFAKILTGAYLPSAGYVAYDGQKTEELRRRSLYEHISVVLQDFVHYQFTLRENIGISCLRRMEEGMAIEERAGAGEKARAEEKAGGGKKARAKEKAGAGEKARAEEKAGGGKKARAKEKAGAGEKARAEEKAGGGKKARAEEKASVGGKAMAEKKAGTDRMTMEELVSRVAGKDFLQKIGGLDVQIGREFGGEELSGGEWQKIAVARGLWKDSDIIILDEPTSALDPLVEYDILSKFVEMIQDKTSVIISHRVGICRSADKIIVMKDGKMAECGRHEELLEKQGEYARIWREQAKWYA